MTVFLHGDGEHVRLKSYDATIKGKTTLLRVVLEVTDPYELSHILMSLERTQAEQAAKRKPPSAKELRSDHGQTKIERQTLLALPPPNYDEEL